MTLPLVIEAFEFGCPTRTLDHLKESALDIHQQGLRKFRSSTQDQEYIEKFEGKVNEAMSSFHVCKILLSLIGSLTLKFRSFSMRKTSKVC